MEELKELLSGLGSRFIEMHAEQGRSGDFPDQPFSSYFSLDSGRAGRSLWKRA